MLFWGPNLCCGTDTHGWKAKKSPVKRCTDACCLTLCGINTSPRHVCHNIVATVRRKVNLLHETLSMPAGIMIASSGLCPAKNDTSDICAMRCPNPLVSRHHMAFSCSRFDFACGLMPCMVFGIAALLNLGVPEASFFWRTSMRTWLWWSISRLQQELGVEGYSGRGCGSLLLTNPTKTLTTEWRTEFGPPSQCLVFDVYQRVSRDLMVYYLTKSPTSHRWCILTAQLDRCLETHGRHRQDPFLCKGCASPNLLWLSWLLYAMKPLGIYSVTLWTAQKVEKDKLASLLKIWMSFGVVVACISPSIQTSKTVTDVAGHLETGAASGRNSQLSERVDMKWYYLIKFVHFVNRADKYFVFVKHSMYLRFCLLRLQFNRTTEIEAWAFEPQTCEKSSSAKVKILCLLQHSWAAPALIACWEQAMPVWLPGFCCHWLQLWLCGCL